MVASHNQSSIEKAVFMMRQLGLQPSTSGMKLHITHSIGVFLSLWCCFKATLLQVSTCVMFCVRLGTPKEVRCTCRTGLISVDQVYGMSYSRHCFLGCLTLFNGEPWFPFTYFPLRLSETRYFCLRDVVRQRSFHDVFAASQQWCKPRLNSCSDRGDRIEAPFLLCPTMSQLTCNADFGDQNLRIWGCRSLLWAAFRHGRSPNVPLG